MKKFFISASILLALLAAGAWLYWDELGHWLGRAPVEQAADARAGHVTPAGGQAGEKKILYWYDPMHPQYRSDKPGTAPDCGMELVPQYAEEEADRPMAEGTVRISAERQQLIGVKTARAERQSVLRTIRAVGRVTIDETRIAHIHTKVAGYVEHVYADFVGKEVKAGEPLFTIYSPELVATQQEYLVALRGRAQLKDSSYREVSEGAESLVRSARERLKLWDVSEADIQRLEREGKVVRELPVYSPVSGIVTERKAYHHGRYVTPDTDIFTITDYSVVWVIAECFEYEAPYIRLGQQATVRLSYVPEKEFTGQVSFIYPDIDSKTRTVRVRFELANPGLELKPEMYADVELAVDLGTHVVVPREAVLDSGNEQTIFVAHGDGYFEPRRVKLGPRLPGLPRPAALGERVIVLEGIRPGETVVTSANFLIDSESRLKATASGSTQHRH
jgi:RND family efflux transporter MFP subunit